MSPCWASLASAVFTRAVISTLHLPPNCAADCRTRNCTGADTCVAAPTGRCRLSVCNETTGAVGSVACTGFCTAGTAAALQWARLSDDGRRILLQFDQDVAASTPNTRWGLGAWGAWPAGRAGSSWRQESHKRVVQHSQRSAVVSNWTGPASLMLPRLPACPPAVWRLPRPQRPSWAP